MLVEGAVTLSPRAMPDAAVRLAPGQRSTVLALDAPTAPERADLGALDWAGAVFAGEATAGEIVRRLSDRFDATIGIDRSLSGETLSAAEWGADGLRPALEVLAAALGARVEVEGTGFRITE